ncbi:MAG: hypothetical protein LCH46_00710 [Proteobacteria bacterium]|nr:hypothetical protein [Pseudomonadota bacterium]
MLLGLDIGTQSVKALLVDERLETRGIGNAPLTFTAGADGKVEQRPQDWLDALKPAIAEALRSAGLRKDNILSLGIGGQLDGCVPVDGNGVPLHSCLTWMDRRATKEAERVSKIMIRERCGIVRDASHMAAKIAWLQGHLPDLTWRTAVYHQPVSFVVQHLTGAIVMDRALASTTMLYDLGTQGWSEPLLAGFGIEAAKMPAIAGMADVAGPLTDKGAALTGLSPGLAVAVGTGDDFTNAIGAGLLSPGAMLCQVGTGEVVGALHPTCSIDDKALLETHEFADGHYFIENPGWLSGGAIAWLVKLLRLSGTDELNQMAARIPPGSDGVLFFPALTGAMAPEWNANIHACFHNLSANHGAGHLIRAVLEGTALAMRDVQIRLAGMGVTVDRIVLAGGGAASELWAQIRADVAQLPVDVCGAKDASPLGAAVLAAVAAGKLKTISEAAPLLNTANRRVSPDLRLKPVYDEAHARYRNLFSHLKAMAPSAD